MATSLGIARSTDKRRTQTHETQGTFNSRQKTDPAQADAGLGTLDQFDEADGADISEGRSEVLRSVLKKKEKPMKHKFTVRVALRKKGQRKDRIVWAEDINEARAIAFKRFGPNRGVRPLNSD